MTRDGNWAGACDSIVERLAWAAVHTVPQPYRVITPDA
jgi:hypothetical protein